MAWHQAENMKLEPGWSEFLPDKPEQPSYYIWNLWAPVLWERLCMKATHKAQTKARLQGQRLSVSLNQPCNWKAPLVSRTWDHTGGWYGGCGGWSKGPRAPAPYSKLEPVAAMTSSHFSVSCSLKSVVCLLFSLQITTNSKKEKKKSFRFRNLRPSVSHSIPLLLEGWISCILSFLPLTLPTCISAGSIVTLCDYCGFNEKAGFSGIKLESSLFLQSRCLGWFTWIFFHKN
jgi:hypothetical protein